MENKESQRTKNSFSNILSSKRHVILIAVLSVFVGIFSGAICALFGRTLLYLDSLRVANPFRFIPFLAVAGVFIVCEGEFECGDIVKLDKKIGIFEVVRRAMLLDDEHCQMIMEFCGAGDASEMPRVIGKWVNMGDQYDV